MKRLRKKKQLFLTSVFLSSTIVLAVLAIDGVGNSVEAALTAADCRVCHIGENHRDRISWEFVTDMGPAHHAIQKANRMKCVECHTADPQTVRISDCLLCHEDDGHGVVEPPPEVPVEQPPPAESGTGAALTTADCRVCHTGEKHKDRISGEFVTDMGPAHHAIQRTNKMRCVECHAADPQAVRISDCLQCHEDDGHGVVETPPEVPEGPPPPAETPEDLPGVSTNSAICLTCHTGDWNFIYSLGTFGNNMAPAHHALQRANKWACVECHTTKDANNRYIQEKTCVDCHSSSGHTDQHDSVGPTDETCTQCHDANVVVEHVANQNVDCAACHSNPSYAAVIGSGRSGIGVTCFECHGEINHTVEHDHVGPTSGTCTQCHDTNVVVEHVTNRNVPCTACHNNPAYAAVIDSGRSGTAVTCYNCHGAPNHHLKPEAVSGNCTYCHADPRLEISASAPTGKLACYACHGPNKHNVGPVQNFGACFACHQPVPYHAKPTGWPGWYKENQAAPGRGLFNFFKTQFKPGCSGNCKSKYEKRSGYGENGQPKSKRDTNWSTPTYNNTKYTMVNITDIRGTNRQWSVPVLTGVVGGGGQSDSVTVTYASYSSSNRIVTVYAVNTMTNSTTMTMKYNNNNYPMTWDSNDNRWEVQVNSYSCNDSTIDVVSAAGGSGSKSVSNCN